MTSYFSIPVVPERNQRFRVTLSGITYTFQFVWNAISICWVMDIYDNTGIIPILRGIPIVTGADLLGQFAYLDIAAHAVLLALTVGPGISPDEVATFENFGIDGQLLYITP